MTNSLKLFIPSLQSPKRFKMCHHDHGFNVGWRIKGVTGGYSLVAEKAVENESDDGYLFEYQERTLSVISECFYALPVIMK
jgi:hypothetical protein